MSKNCVDVTIDLSNNYEIPIFLIASRRQIDSEEFSGVTLTIGQQLISQITFMKETKVVLF